jgi:hypothetical protein
MMARNIAQTFRFPHACRRAKKARETSVAAFVKTWALFSPVLENQPALLQARLRAREKIPFAAGADRTDKLLDMKLRQNQVWHLGGEFLRIVALDRLEVQYKTMKNLATGEGKHVTATKKEFCRLIKGAKLLAPEEEAGFRAL